MPLLGLGTGEKAAVFRKLRYLESYITYKTHIWDLKMGGGIGIWEGGGIGSGGIEGDDRAVSH